MLELLIILFLIGCIVTPIFKLITWTTKKVFGLVFGIVMFVISMIFGGLFAIIVPIIFAFFLVILFLGFV